MKHIVLNNIILPFAAADVQDGEAETIEVDEKLAATLALAAETGALVTAAGELLTDEQEASQIRGSLASDLRETAYTIRKASAQNKGL